MIQPSLHTSGKNIGSFLEIRHKHWYFNFVKPQKTKRRTVFQLLTDPSFYQECWIEIPVHAQVHFQDQLFPDAAARVPAINCCILSAFKKKKINSNTLKASNSVNLPCGLHWFPPLVYESSPAMCPQPSFVPLQLVRPTHLAHFVAKKIWIQNKIKFWKKSRCDYIYIYIYEDVQKGL